MVLVLRYSNENRSNTRFLFFVYKYLVIESFAFNRPVVLETLRSEDATAVKTSLIEKRICVSQSLSRLLGTSNIDKERTTRTLRNRGRLDQGFRFRCAAFVFVLKLKVNSNLEQLLTCSYSKFRLLKKIQCYCNVLLYFFSLRAPDNLITTSCSGVHWK